MRLILLFFLPISISLSAQTGTNDKVAKKEPLFLPSLSGIYKRPTAFLLDDGPQSDDPKRNHLERRFLLHIATDQVDFIRGGGRFRVKDLRWALPLAGAAGLTLATDPKTSRNLAGSNPKRWKSKTTASDIGLLMTGALAGGTYLWGTATHDDQKRETGVLAIEAATDAVIDNELIKQIFRRDRPTVGTGEGFFFNSPTRFPSDAGFASGHAMTSWAIASVIAHEYPDWRTQSAAYGLAAMTSVMRVAGKKHFASDVLVGSALGWYIGHQVYRSHHNPDLAAMDIGTFKEAEFDGKLRNLGSTYVPLDSWVYEAMDRLAGMGVLSTNLSNMRPWTRLECARLVQEAESSVHALDLEYKNAAPRLIRDLRQEFGREYEILNGKENRNAAVESLYARVTTIDGPPLRDGYHFGQTIYNDYGRPFAEGGNFIGGGSTYAAKGPWSVYFRAEYQHSPPSSPFPLAAQTAIANLELTPQVSGFQLNEINRARILDAYAAFTVRKWQFSFGKQSMWWGPDHEGSMNYSNNAEPVTMFKISTVMPLDLPWILKFLGPTKGEAFFGQLDGHQFLRTSTGFFGPDLDRQPYIEGIKVAFKPTENFEFGVSVSSVWGGDGVPITFASFRRSFSPGNTIPGQPSDPGDRRTGFDFKYRIPGLRRWLTLYNDAMAEDEISPIAYPRRSSHAPGLYLSHVPGMEKLDIRAEGYYTDLPGLQGVGVWYSNGHYVSGFTNEGFLLGHPVGRQGTGYTVKATYWFAPQQTVTFGYRHVKVNPDFLNGGHIEDYFVRTNWKLDTRWFVNAAVQYEHSQFPDLARTQQTKVATSISIVFKPQTSKVKQ